MSAQGYKNVSLRIWDECKYEDNFVKGRILCVSLVDIFVWLGWSGLRFRNGMGAREWNFIIRLFIIVDIKYTMALVMGKLWKNTVVTEIESINWVAKIQ